MGWYQKHGANCWHTAVLQCTDTLHGGYKQLVAGCSDEEVLSKLSCGDASIDVAGAVDDPASRCRVNDAVTMVLRGNGILAAVGAKR